jgi:hypothetical protein
MPPLTGGAAFVGLTVRTPSINLRETSSGFPTLRGSYADARAGDIAKSEMTL